MYRDRDQAILPSSNEIFAVRTMRRFRVVTNFIRTDYQIIFLKQCQFSIAFYMDLGLSEKLKFFSDIITRLCLIIIIIIICAVVNYVLKAKIKLIKKK